MSPLPHNNTHIVVPYPSLAGDLNAVVDSCKRALRRGADRHRIAVLTRPAVLVPHHKVGAVEHHLGPELNAVPSGGGGQGNAQVVPGVKVVGSVHYHRVVVGVDAGVCVGRRREAAGCATRLGSAERKGYR